MSTQLQERKVTWKSLPKLFTKMDEIHDKIRKALDNELLRAYLLQVIPLKGTYHWFFIAHVNDSKDNLVLFIEHNSARVKPRFALMDRDEHISLIKGISISGDVEEMQAIYDKICAAISVGYELKERGVPLYINLKRRRNN